LLKNIFLLSNRAALALAGAVTVKIYTSILPISEVGKLAYLTTLCQFFSMIAVYPVGSYFQRHIVKWHRNGRLREGIWTFVTQLTIGAAMCGIMGSFFGASGGLGIQVNVYALGAVVTLVLVGPPMKDAMLVVLNLLGYSKSYAAVSTIVAYLILLGSYLVCASMPRALIWLMAGAGISVISAIGLVIWASRIKYNSLEKLNSATRDIGIISFAIPLVATAIGLWFVTDSNRLVITHVNSLESLAMISVSLGVGASLMQVFEKTFNDIQLPFVYRSSSESSDDLIRCWHAYFEKLVYMCVFSLIAITAVAPYLTSFLLGTAFKEIGYLIVFGAVLRVGVSILTAFYTLTQLQDKPRTLWYHSFLGGGGANCIIYFYSSRGGSNFTMFVVNVGVWLTVILAAATVVKNNPTLRMRISPSHIHLKTWITVVAVFFAVVLFNADRGILRAGLLVAVVGASAAVAHREIFRDFTKMRTWLTNS
jgi:O-antigen/teichoic acid export membrane protein